MRVSVRSFLHLFFQAAFLFCFIFIDEILAKVKQLVSIVFSAPLNEIFENSFKFSISIFVQGVPTYSKASGLAKNHPEPG